MANIGEKEPGSLLPVPGDTSAPRSSVASPLLGSLEDVVDPSPVIEEFQYLLEKSQQLFSGLRWRQIDMYLKVY